MNIELVDTAIQFQDKALLEPKFLDNIDINSEEDIQQNINKGYGNYISTL